MARSLLAVGPLDGGAGFQEGWVRMMTCDYNGWNDAPEDEREWFDQHPEIWSGPVLETDKRPYRGTWLDRRGERRAS
jgi:hypothetical protein